MELNMPEQKPEPKAPKVKAKPVKEKEPFKSPTLAGLGVTQEPSEILQDKPSVNPEILQNAKMVNPPAKVIPNEQEVYIELDKRDEDQIIGQSMEEFVYEFCPRHKWPGGVRPFDCNCKDTILDLSWTGIAEVSRKMKITVMEGTTWLVHDANGARVSGYGDDVKDPGVLMMEFPEKVRAMVRAKDPETGAIRVGIASCSKKITFRNGGSKDDEFYEQKALSKAERNVLRQLIPQAVIKKSIADFLQRKYGSATKTPQGKPLPPAKESTLKQVLEVAEASGLEEVTMDVLKSKIANEKTALFCIDEIKKGRIREFATFIGLEPKTIDQDSQKGTLNGPNETEETE